MGTHAVLVGAVIRRVLQRFFEVNGPFLAAGLAFYVLLYCLPLLLLFVTMLTFTVLESRRAVEAVQDFVSELVPVSETAILGALSGAVERRELLGLVSLVGLLLFGSFMFGAVRHVLNTVFGVEQRRALFRAWISDFLAMLGAGGLLALALGLGSAIALLFDFATRIPALEPYVSHTWTFFGRLMAVAFTWGLLYLLFRVAPARSLPPRALFVAATVGVGLLELSKWLFSWYVGAARAYAVVYGALAGLVFFMLWAYYASSVFVLAAIVGREVERTLYRESASNQGGSE